MNCERGSCAQDGINFHTTAVRADDATNCGQPESGPSLARGEKWIENSRQIFLANASAFVRHFNNNFAFRVIGGRLIDANRNTSCRIGVERRQAVYVEEDGQQQSILLPGAWIPVLPGAVVATAMWFATTLVFGWYVTRWGKYAPTSSMPSTSVTNWDSS